MEDRITGSPDHCMVLWGEYVTMEAIIDFLRAALPWIAIGLLLAVFAARNAGRKKKERKRERQLSCSIIIQPIIQGEWIWAEYILKINQGSLE